MQAPVHRRLWPGLCWLGLSGTLAYLLYSLVLYGLAIPINQYHPGFALLSTWRVPFFNDLRWVLSFSSCGENIGAILEAGTRCNGYTNPGYPNFSIWLPSKLGLGPGDASWIGLTAGIGLIISSIVVLQKIVGKQALGAAIIAVLFASYPFQAVLENGNIDSIIFMIMVFSCLLPELRNFWPWLTPVLSAAAIALKIYPFLGYAAWLVHSQSRLRLRRSLKFLPLLIALASTTSLIITLKTTADSIAITMLGYLASHGLLASGYINTPLITSIGLQKARIVIWIAILAKALIFCGGLAIFSRHFLMATNNIESAFSHVLFSRFSRAILIAMSGTGVGCYIISISYDHRFIYSFPAIALVAKLSLDRATPRSGLKNLMRIQTLCAAYILYLPLLSYFNLPSGARLIPERITPLLEALDEFAAAPFLFSGLTILLVYMIVAPPTLKQETP